MCRPSLLAREDEVKELEPMNDDSEAVYDELIAPLVTQIIAVCREHRIPVLATFQYRSDADGPPAFCTTRVPFAGMSGAINEAVEVLMGRPKVFGVTITSGGAK